jgi:DNA-binding XRE family transcriptional regulator
MSRPSKDLTTPVENRIEQVRQERGLSRSDLAELVGVHYQTMGYLERGEYNPSLELALKIGRALEVGLQEIFWLEDKVSTPAGETEKAGQLS